MARDSRNKGGKPRGDRTQQALLRAAAIAGAAGAAYLIGSKLRAPSNGPMASDAPPSTRRGGKRGGSLVGKTVTVNKPREELYAFWRDYSNLPRFMDNVRAVEEDGEISRWTMAAPAGTSVTLVNRTVEDVPGEVIAWESTPESSLRNSGRIEFIDAAPGRGTMVRATISYDPPGGPVGKVVAKVLQREPQLQARRDLRRFKQLMETGEVTNSASPSGRPSESPAVQSL